MFDCNHLQDLAKKVMNAQYFLQKNLLKEEVKFECWHHGGMS